jgi:hypothetical protein
MNSKLGRVFVGVQHCWTPCRQQYNRDSKRGFVGVTQPEDTPSNPCA